MGVHVVLAPGSILPDLPAILLSTSGRVHTEHASDENVRRGLLAVFTCITDDGETVQLECHRSTTEPGMLILVLKPLRPGNRKERTVWLITRIESILRSRGATDLPRQEAK
jgi:hypothetical protein